MVGGGWRNISFFVGISMLIGTKSNLYSWVAPLNKAYYVYRNILSKDLYFPIVQKQLLTDNQAGLWFDICLVKESGFQRIQTFALLGYKLLSKTCWFPKIGIG